MGLVAWARASTRLSQVAFDNDLILILRSGPWSAPLDTETKPAASIIWSAISVLVGSKYYTNWLVGGRTD